jgi:hypothetical protein
MGFSGGSGSSSIGSSTDVALSNPSNNQVLTYDGTQAKWKNATPTGGVDTTAVHMAGAETITGTKTFAVSPSVPTPTNASDAANKSYVDGKTVSYATLTAGSLIAVDYNTGNAAYPNRPTSRTDIVVRWRGSVAPAVGGNAAVDNVDEWLNTAP